MLAALPTASPEVVRDITIAVLTQPVDEGGYDWISNTNLTDVRNLYRTLREGPYAYLRDWSAAGLCAAAAPESSPLSSPSLTGAVTCRVTCVNAATRGCVRAS